MSILQDLRREPTVGVDDMVMLGTLSDKSIVDNLRQRHARDMIYTSIGNVLISVNPFKRLPIYTAEQIHFYKTHGKTTSVPHIFGLAENMYRSMIMEEENQCVIISGESGAGKTEASKQIMQYIAAVSGDSAEMQRVKEIMLESNPLLEAFGNAKTVRNDNSSRFGKFFEIYFDRYGGPLGGKMSNFLLEKSRVVRQQRGERNFHVFYQLCCGADAATRQRLRLRDAGQFAFLNQGQTLERAGVDDGVEWNDTVKAMKKIGFSDENQKGVVDLLAAILHIGEIKFSPIAGKEECTVANADAADFVASLLGVDKAQLARCLTWKRLEIGANEIVDVPLDMQQCNNAREALAKTIYDKIFNFVVAQVNIAFGKKPYALMLGVLDIYGFEIFDKNGFEQFCINYVNEKLQQIFIELTLKVEQEEYVREKIKWEEIKYFNNKIVCDLIEGKNPAGLFAIMDDVCATMAKEREAVADVKLLDKLDGMHCGHAHFRRLLDKGFVLKHYAGDVVYDTAGFVNRNKDLLSADIMTVIASTTNPLLAKLVEDIEVDTAGRPGSPASGLAQAKKKATTAGFKIREQAASLVQTLMKCHPHYVRTIKSNDDKQPNFMDEARVVHQAKYLGLLENIRVRRAGFAYRQYFDKFLKRFKYTCPQTYPRPFRGTDKQACELILRANAAHVPAEHWQLGETKVFLRHPQTLYAMEERRERTFDGLVSKIQKAYLRFRNRREYIVLKKRMDNLYAKAGKARRSDSVFRPFQGTYIDYRRDLTDMHPFVEYDPIAEAWREEFSPEAKKYYFNKVTGRSQWERPKDMDKQRVIYSDKVERVVDHPRGAKREETFILSDRNIFFLENRLETITPPQVKPTKQNPKPVQPQPYTQMKIYLHKKLDVRFLGGISTSRQADGVVVLHFYPSPVPYRPIEAFAGKEYTHCMLSGTKFGAKDKRVNCPSCGLLCLPQFLSAARPVPTISGHAKPVAMCEQCAAKPEPWEPTEDVVILSTQKTEIIAILRRVYKQLLGIKLPVNINDNISYQLAGEKAPRTITFQLNAAAPDTALYVGGPTQLVVHAPLGISQERINELGAAREARAKAAQERLRNERSAEASKEAAKEKEREEAHKRLIEQRKAERAAAAEREEQEKEDKQRRAREEQEKSRARVAAKQTS
jgi:myosin-1